MTQPKDTWRAEAQRVLHNVTFADVLPEDLDDGYRLTIRFQSEDDAKIFEAGYPRALDALDKADADKLPLLEALESIINLTEKLFEFPSDWQEQIDGCAECQRYKGHPIQQGICNEHRQPLYERDRHDEFERKAIGHRAKRIARDALDNYRKALTND